MAGQVPSTQQIRPRGNAAGKRPAGEKKSNSPPSSRSHSAERYEPDPANPSPELSDDSEQEGSTGKRPDPLMHLSSHGKHRTGVPGLGGQSAFDSHYRQLERQMAHVDALFNTPVANTQQQLPAALRGWWGKTPKSKESLTAELQALDTKIAKLRIDGSKMQFGPHNPAPREMTKLAVESFERHRKTQMSQEVELLEQKTKWIRAYLAGNVQDLEGLRPSSAAQPPKISNLEGDLGKRPVGTASATSSGKATLVTGLQRKGIQKAFQAPLETSQQQQKAAPVRKASRQPQSMAQQQLPANLRGWWEKVQKSGQPLEDHFTALQAEIANVMKAGAELRFALEKAQQPARQPMSTQSATVLQHRRQSILDGLETLEKKIAWIKTVHANSKQQQASSSTN